MHGATSRGVYIVKEITKNTCEWTWVQQIDLKITIHARLLDIAAGQTLGWANDYQERFRRNGKEVDQEGVAALAEVMEKRRGKPLVEDQVALFKRCEALLGEEGKEGWKPLESKSQEVEMKIQHFPPKQGERQVATGKAVGVADCSAEEIASWVVDILSNERTRISKEFKSPARLEFRELRRLPQIAFFLMSAVL